ncbi:hypothetical protein MKW98_003687 [Papaver atlanticum]|uniref:Cysteine synthase n=1 Tax=Papaver atlanticum TaxID=357466 RepID=A0AAD4SIU7_9MAGN|nr:hypothetical protein MKW98_003687 [Papaver atlanticum]
MIITSTQFQITGCGAYIACKQEMVQPTASIKDRPALDMIEDADILDIDILEEVIEESLIQIFHTLSNVTSDDAMKMARELALKEGLMVGISSGANTVDALKLSQRPENKGKLIVPLTRVLREHRMRVIQIMQLWVISIRY